MSAHTPGPWIWSFFCKPSGEPILTVEDVAEVTAGSAKYSERAELFGVTLDDADKHEDGRATVVCYTGNGPNAHNNARLIAAAPELLDLVRGVSDLSVLVNFPDRERDLILRARKLIASIEGEAQS